MCVFVYFFFVMYLSVGFVELSLQEHFNLQFIIYLMSAYVFIFLYLCITSMN